MLTTTQQIALAALLGALFACLAAVVYVAVAAHPHKPPALPPPAVRVINA